VRSEDAEVKDGRDGRMGARAACMHLTAAGEIEGGENSVRRSGRRRVEASIVSASVSLVGF
jgi:hypothetical protein